MKKRIFYLSAVILAGLISSCDLEDALGDRTTTEDLQDASVVIEDQTNTQLNTISIFENVNNYGFNQTSVKSLVSDAPTASWSGNTLTLDFTGVTDCSGQVIIAFNGLPVLSPNVAADITFVNYVSNGVSMAGEIELKVLEFTATPKFSYKSVGALTIQEGSNAAFEYTFDQTIIWAAGSNTPLVSDDDTYYFEGSAQQVVGNVTNEMVIEEKLVFAATCDYPKEGIVLFTNDAGSDNEFEVRCDFSVGATDNASGECDGYIKVYTDDLSLKINLEN